MKHNCTSCPIAQASSARLENSLPLSTVSHQCQGKTRKRNASPPASPSLVRYSLCLPIDHLYFVAAPHAGSIKVGVNHSSQEEFMPLKLVPTAGGPDVVPNPVPAPDPQPPKPDPTQEPAPGGPKWPFASFDAPTPSRGSPINFVSSFPLKFSSCTTETASTRSDCREIRISRRPHRIVSHPEGTASPG
jgi:hypothetical protein